MGCNEVGECEGSKPILQVSKWLLIQVKGLQFPVLHFSERCMLLIVETIVFSTFLANKMGNV